MTRGDAVEEASAIAAGAGNVKVNGASRRRGLLQLVVPDGWLPLSLGGATFRLFCRLNVAYFLICDMVCVCFTCHDAFSSFRHCHPMSSSVILQR
jgi:hypothetical protein